MQNSSSICIQLEYKQFSCSEGNMLTIVENQKQQLEINLYNALETKLKSSKFNEKVNKLNSHLMQTIIQDINKCQIVIRQTQKPFSLKRKESKQKPVNMLEDQMKQIQQKKLAMINEIKQLQNEEHKLQLNQSRLSNSTLKQSKISNMQTSKKFRSQLTAEQKQTLKELLKNQKKFIKQLKKKEKEYYQYVDNNRRQALELDQTIKKQKCFQRKHYWQKIRQEIQQRRKKREIQFVEEQQRLKSVKKSKKLYKQMEKAFNNSSNIQHQKLQQIKQQIKKRNLMFNTDKIVEHKIQYQKISQKNEQNRQQSVEQRNKKMKQSLPHIPKSRFLQSILEEEKAKRQQQEEKQRKKEELISKKADFTKYVKQNYKPTVNEALKIDVATNNNQQSIGQQKKIGILSQIRNVGNDYMRKINKNISLAKLQKQQKLKQNKIIQVTKLKPSLHHNYLQQLKQRRHTGQAKPNVTSQVQRIMNNSTYSMLQKIERTKIVAKKLEIKQNQKSSTLVSSINQKMKILQLLSKE